MQMRELKPKSDDPSEHKRLLKITHITIIMIIPYFSYLAIANRRNSAFQNRPKTRSRDRLQFSSNFALLFRIQSAMDIGFAHTYLPIYLPRELSIEMYFADYRVPLFFSSKNVTNHSHTYLHTGKSLSPPITHATQCKYIPRGTYLGIKCSIKHRIFC